MDLKKDNAQEKRGFNPLNVGYSGNAYTIADRVIVEEGAASENGRLQKSGTPHLPKPPKGGTGESEIKLHSSED